MVSTHSETLSFSHFVDVPRCNCLFGTARDNKGKTHLYLLFNDQSAVYKRNGAKGTWEQLHSVFESRTILDLIHEAVDSGAPRYTTDSAEFILN